MITWILTFVLTAITVFIAGAIIFYVIAGIFCLPIVIAEKLREMFGRYK